MSDVKAIPDDDNKIYGEVCYRKERRERQKLLISELLYEYAKNSTLHGLRYTVDRGLHVLEKIFWMLTFFLSVGMCFYLITNVWIKWKTSPVIVSFSERVVPVGDVPFPSITICPQLKSKASVFNYSAMFVKYLQTRNSPNNNIANGQWDKLDHIDMLCSINSAGAVTTHRPFSNSSMIEHFFEVSPTVEDVFAYCEWRGDYIECAKTFKSVVTNEGICYNFNALAANEILRMENKHKALICGKRTDKKPQKSYLLLKDYKYLNTSRPSVDWTVSKGYSDFRPTETYPRRGRENNASPDLKVILQESPKHRDDLCNSVRSGYTIYVQHPADLPQSSLYYYAALPGQVSSLALKFSMVATDEGLKGYSPEIRQCYFPEDRELRYFRIYTPSNCRLECQSNYTFAKCGCVWFHMPYSDSRKLCINSTSVDCMKDALDKLSMAEIKTKIKVGHTRPCHCLPSCDSIQYDAEILKTDFNVKTFLETRARIMNDMESSFTSRNLSQIDVYFKEPRFISMRRSELFGITDFMANIGGLLGLFLGFSFLSLVEIFYFATIRIFTILRRDLREEKANRGK